MKPKDIVLYDDRPGAGEIAALIESLSARAVEPTWDHDQLYSSKHREARRLRAIAKRKKK